MQSDSARICQSCEILFKEEAVPKSLRRKISGIIFGDPETLPEPRLCPECRFERRLAYRPWAFMTMRSASGPEGSPSAGRRIFSMYPPETPFPVFAAGDWWADGWDAFDFGQEIDFFAPFFPQFKALRNRVPHRSANLLQSENSDYCNTSLRLKNCYLVFNAVDFSDCMYCDNGLDSRDSLDCSRILRSELCYECTNCESCFDLQESYNCERCSESRFLANCRNCRRCYGCVNLSNCEYMIFNLQATPDEYVAFIKQRGIELYSVRAIERLRFREICRATPHPHATQRLTEDVSGNHISEAKDIYHSIFVHCCNELAYCYGHSGNAQDCMDCNTGGQGCQAMYECSVAALNCQRIAFCYDCYDGNTDLLYCSMCHHCSDCFGCVGLRRQRFCILNRQYSASDYYTLRREIVSLMIKHGEWGEFFPIEDSPQPYNNSLAAMFFSRNRREADLRGLHWHVREMPHGGSAAPEEDLPDGLPQDDEPIVAASSIDNAPYRITSEELRRYRMLKVPLPRETHEQRMSRRRILMGGVQLLNRTCCESGRELLTTLDADNFPLVIEASLFHQRYWS